MMPMPVYISEIEYVVEPTFSTIWGERKRLNGLKSEVAKLARIADHNYQQAEFVQMNAEDPDDVAMGAGMYWSTYCGEYKERFYREQDKDKLEEVIGIHQFAVNSMSANLLQLAKQGISIVHGGLAGCPDGRLIGSQPLKFVIWQSRNQALHWEAGDFHPPVRHCFDTLAHEIDPKFAEYTTRNMAFDVIELLGWVEQESFKNDMISLS